MHLVIGATGALGSRIAARLLRQDGHVRVLSRDRARLASLVEAGAEPRVGDLLAPHTLAAACEGATTITLAAHGLVPISRANHPAAVDGEGTRALIDVAARAGVQRVVHVSVRQADARASAFARIKHDTETHLARISAGSDVAHTILRPTIFMENHALILLGEPLRDGAPVRFLGRGETMINWVSADDVADFAVQALENPGAPSEVLEVEGPDTMTRLEALALLEAAVGRRARRSHLPLPLVRVLGGTLGRVNPGLGVLLDLAIAEETTATGGKKAPRPPDRVGQTSLADVAGRWARMAR